MSEIIIHDATVYVVLSDAMDLVQIHTNLPSPFPPEVTRQPLKISFQTEQGKGIEYVRSVFGIEPEVIRT